MTRVGLVSFRQVDGGLWMSWQSEGDAMVQRSAVQGLDIWFSQTKVKVLARVLGETGVAV